MRDPKRINKVLNEIKVIWKKYPDLRLGQLLLNIVSNPNSLYYIEDEDLVEFLKQIYLKKI